MSYVLIDSINRFILIIPTASLQEILNQKDICGATSGKVAMIVS